MINNNELAKSLLANSSQGKARANQLWEQLAAKLNASGPPIKDVKMWRKVYADQKQNVKKKFSFNKSSKKSTGGGPYEEKTLTHVEEQILAAPGIEVAVEGLKAVKSFGSILKTQTEPKSNLKPLGDEFSIIAPEDQNNDLPCTSSSLVLDSNHSSCIEDDDLKESVPEKRKIIYGDIKKTIVKKRETKTTLLKKNMMTTENYQKEMLKRLDSLIEGGDGTMDGSLHVDYESKNRPGFNPSFRLKF